MQMKYYYMGRADAWNRQRRPIPTGSFRAIRMKNKKGDWMFYPIVEQELYNDKFFVYHLGWVNMRGRKIYEIPVYDGEASHWMGYLERYGGYCLYFSINGKEFNNDCCDRREIMEFLSICRSGEPESYPEFVGGYLRMNEIQKEKGATDDMLFRPNHEFFGFAFPFMTDVADDDKMVLFWMRFGNKEIDFPECMKDRMNLIYGSECAKIYEKLLKQNNNGQKAS